MLNMSQEVSQVRPMTKSCVTYIEQTKHRRTFPACRMWHGCVPMQGRWLQEGGDEYNYMYIWVPGAVAGTFKIQVTCVRVDMRFNIHIKCSISMGRSRVLVGMWNVDCVFFWIYLSIDLPIHLLLYLSIHPSRSIYLYPAIYLSIYLSIQLSIYVSIYLSIPYLFI